MTFGVPEEDAVRAASYNPACALCAEDKIGSIEEGKFADFIVCRNDYTEKTVYLGGKAL
jgi:imidazolonepropionase-like amidohydrolase